MFIVMKYLFRRWAAIHKNGLRLWREIGFAEVEWIWKFYTEEFMSILKEASGRTDADQDIRKRAREYVDYQEGR